MSSQFCDMRTNQLIASLCNASIYDHEVSKITTIETHISWIVLTGEYAYKIKKPVKFSFVDFSTLEKRKFYCNEEVRLNRRLAPNLYLCVVGIAGTLEHPSLKKNGIPIEYAVKMRQFSQSHMLSSLSADNQLSPKNIDDMAGVISNFHLHIDRVKNNSQLGSPEDIHRWVTDNFSQIEKKLNDRNSLSSLKHIQTWSENEYIKKYDQLQYRKRNKYIRECHGDMHLDNMVLIKDKVTIFDGIEFNEHLRWIDVMSEVAFVAMDLRKHGHREYANRFLNLYLQHTGDYAGLCILKYYLVYRAMVRSKVELLRIAQQNITQKQKNDALKNFKSYVSLASSYILDYKPALIITHGFSGSGKSTHTESLLEYLGAIRIRSDIERKRLHGYSPSQNTQSSLNENIYSPNSSEATYARLAAISTSILSSGFTVIVDACFLQDKERRTFHKLALELQVPFIILDFQASEATLKKRILARAKSINEPSEADIEVLNAQLDHSVPLDMIEKNNSINVDTENNIRTEALVKAIEQRCNKTIQNEPNV